MQHTLNETLLKVENVSVKRGNNLILKDVNVEIKNIVRPDMHQGQVVGLLGPSGVGKTTLFRILSGMEKPDTGIVTVHREQTPVERGMVGVVSQHYPLFQHRTVLSNLVVAGKQGGFKGKAAKDRAMTLLNRFGVGDHTDKYPSQLSGGQRQRVAIAQQFMCSEHFLLMDEPFSGLDPVAQEEVVCFIEEAAQVNELTTIVVVTHDITAALEVSDTLWLIGRDRDAEGNVIPGAYIKKTYDLIGCGLAWRRGITKDPVFHRMLDEIRDDFRLM